MKKKHKWDLFLATIVKLITYGPLFATPVTQISMRPSITGLLDYSPSLTSMNDHIQAFRLLQRKYTGLGKLSSALYSTAFHQQRKPIIVLLNFNNQCPTQKITNKFGERYSKTHLAGPNWKSTKKNDLLQLQPLSFYFLPLDAAGAVLNFLIYRSFNVFWQPMQTKITLPFTEVI